MSQDQTIAPESSAVRVALWRALHLEVEEAPHIFVDEIGISLVHPDKDWRKRQDMNPEWTKLFRASIVARARFIEDLVIDQAGKGIDQYVILGAGLDTFAQRRPDIAAEMMVFEVDQPGPQEWKKQRLVELKLGIPKYLQFVPVNFESGESWRDKLISSGFDPKKPAVVASTGVSMYLTREAILDTLRQIAAFAPGTTLAMTYLLPMDLVDPEIRTGFEMAAKGAQASGTPFISFFSPEAIQALAREAGFKEAKTITADILNQRYFQGRTDGLKLLNSEEMLIATT